MLMPCKNAMPFGRDSRVDPSNIVLHRGPGSPTGRRDLGVGTPVRSHAACRQIALAIIIIIFFYALGSIDPEG